jgi:hypothetical protein
MPNLPCSNKRITEEVMAMTLVSDGIEDSIKCLPHYVLGQISVRRNVFIQPVLSSPAR